MKVILMSRYPHDFNKPKGGIESVTVIMARTLAKNGVDTYVLTLETQNQEKIIENDDKITIVRLKKLPISQLVDVGLCLEKIKIQRIINDIDPDVIHFHETFGLTFFKSNKPVIFTVHGFDHANIPTENRRFAYFRSVLWKWVERYGLSNHKHIISISPYVTKMIEKYTKARIYEIDNPIDEVFFTVKRREIVGRILSVGWINERKNTLTSIKVLANLKKRGHFVQLAIAGKAHSQSYLNKIKCLIRQKGLEKNVLFLGHIDRNQLLQEQAKASLMLLPALQENAPMAVAEAMAAGIPVVTSNRCGMPYMVEDGRSGYLIEPEDVDGITEKIELILTNDSLREAFGRRGREIAQERFAPQQVIRKTLDVYQRASS